MQKDLEEKYINEKSELEKANDELFLLQNRLKEKEALLTSLKRENDKLSSMQEIKKEILITDPTKVNVDLNNELNYAREVLARISKLKNIEKGKNDNLEKQIKILIEELDNIKTSNITGVCLKCNKNIKNGM